MDYPFLLVEKNSDKVTCIKLNRPEALNALNKSLIENLSDALDELETDAETRVVVLTGAGTKSFVAGADIKEFQSYDAQQGKELARLGHEKLFDRIANYPKPVLAAINGFALGGGLELALACHVRYASENAKMGLPEVTLGLIPGYGGTQRLGALVGKGKALEMILSAQMVDAEDALQWGLINARTSQEDLMDKVMALGAKMARNSGTALEAAIRSVNKSYTKKGYRTEIKEFGKLFGTSDFTEGVTAFLEKRKPNFS